MHLAARTVFLGNFAQIMAANEGSLSSEKKELHVPALQELAGGEGFYDGLNDNVTQFTVVSWP